MPKINTRVLTILAVTPIMKHFVAFFPFHRLQVLDEDKLGRNNFIGETCVALKIFHSKPSQSLKRSLVSRGSVSIDSVVIYSHFFKCRLSCSCFRHEMIWDHIVFFMSLSIWITGAIIKYVYLGKD